MAIGEFCPQEGACEIPVPKQSDQGDALFSFTLEKNVKFWKLKFFWTFKFWNIWNKSLNFDLKKTP